MFDRLVPAAGNRLINIIMQHRPTGVGEIHDSKVDLVEARDVVCQLPGPRAAQSVSVGIPPTG